MTGGTVSAVGYDVPMVVVLVALALVIGLAITVMFWLTVGLSIYRSVQDTRRREVRDDLQAEFLERTFAQDSAWRGWVEQLSGTDRVVVEELLDEYLRELDGQQAEPLRALGDELGLPEQSERRLAGRGEHQRLRALTWLTLLRRPARLHSADFTPRTPRERAAVVRLRYETDDYDDLREGIALLLDGETEQFTVFGQDTLYRLASEQPGALFDIAANNVRTWSEPLLVQVLTVCRHLGTSVTTEDLSWVTGALEHDSDAVREAAARALGNVGWRSDLRGGRFLDRLVDDPSPAVRSAVYRMLSRWGDDHALAALRAGVESERAQRARLAGTDAMVASHEQAPEDAHGPLAVAWAWSAEHANYDSIARERTSYGGE